MDISSGRPKITKNFYFSSSFLAVSFQFAIFILRVTYFIILPAEFGPSSRIFEEFGDYGRSNTQYLVKKSPDAYRRLLLREQIQTGNQ